MPTDDADIYRRFRGKQKKAHIARELGISRPTVSAAIDRMLDKMEAAYENIEKLKGMLR